MDEDEDSGMEEWKRAINRELKKRDKEEINPKQKLERVAS